MKIKKGRRFKCLETCCNENYKKGEVYKVRSIKGSTVVLGDGAIDAAIIKKHFKRLKLKKNTEEPKVEEKKKRILFPWMKTESGRNYKAMLAVLADRNGWDKVISGELSYSAYLAKIVEKTNKHFPNMFKTVSDFYKDKGRVLTENEFKPIDLGRITMMFSFDKESKKIIKEGEHPSNAAGKLDEAVKFCNKLLDKK